MSKINIKELKYSSRLLYPLLQKEYNTYIKLTRPIKNGLRDLLNYVYKEEISKDDIYKTFILKKDNEPIAWSVIHLSPLFTNGEIYGELHVYVKSKYRKNKLGSYLVKKAKTFGDYIKNKYNYKSIVIVTYPAEIIGFQFYTRNKSKTIDIHQPHFTLEELKYLRNKGINLSY